MPVDCSRSQTNSIIVRSVTGLESAARNDSPLRSYKEQISVKFSVGDLVTERKTNLWYLTQYSSYDYYPHYPHSMSEYWLDHESRQNEEISIGIITEIHENEPNAYYVVKYYTYSVLWTTIGKPSFSNMNHRQYLEDELRLLSKINKGVV